MNLFLRHFMLVVLLFAVTGCSSVKNSVNGWMGGDENAHSVSSNRNNQGQQLKYTATLRVDKYEDKRKTDNPRLVGISTLPIRGMPRNKVLLDQEVATIVTAAFKEQFGSAGYQLLEGNGANTALFEVSGVIKELTLNVKDRDEVSIAIETTVKDAATGKVIWSGLATEKNDRFAGVSGNNKNDVIEYLDEELKIASNKTVEAVSASLMALQPELFNLTPGSKVLPGVTVYTSASSATPSPAAMKPGYGVQPASMVTPAPVAVPAPVAMQFTSTTAGLLLVNTNPPRAKVYLDEVYYGLTPLRLELDPGIHAIGVKLEGYKMVTEKVSVRKGGTTEMEINLER